MPAVRRPVVPRPAARGAVVLVAALVALVLGGSGAGPAAAAEPGGSARPTVYRCAGGGTPRFSDSPRLCPDGQAPVAERREAASAVVSSRRLNSSGPPCPLLPRAPEGPAWAPLRACYDRVLAGQPAGVAAESQLAGAVMATCAAETAALANARSHLDLIGRDAEERRQAIAQWARWLVRERGLAVDSVAVLPLRVGRVASIARLNGPLELQAFDGVVSEAFNGSPVPLGSQLHVRPGIGFQLGAQVVEAQTQQARCLLVE